MDDLSGAVHPVQEKSCGNGRSLIPGAMWARTGDMHAGRASDSGGTAADSRLLLKAVPVRFRTGSPWRDIPKRFEVGQRVQALPAPDPPGRSRTYIQRPVGGFRPRMGVRQRHGRPGAPEGGRRQKRGAPGQGIGRSRGGLTTGAVAVAVVDALGSLVRFRILPGQTHDLAGVPGLPGGLPFGAPVGDRVSGADWLPGIWRHAGRRR